VKSGQSRLVHGRNIRSHCQAVLGRDGVSLKGLFENTQGEDFSTAAPQKAHPMLGYSTILQVVEVVHGSGFM
jgi:hypothetical protein